MNEQLLGIITDAIESMDRDGEIVIASSASRKTAARIYDSIMNALPDPKLTIDEANAVGTLILHAIIDPRFFDWEMPTLTGASAGSFRQIAEKLLLRP